MDSKRIIKLAAFILSVAAIVTAIIVFHKQLCNLYANVRDWIKDKLCKSCRPAEYDDFADV